MNQNDQKKQWRKYYNKNRFMTYYNAVMVKTKINHLLVSGFLREKIDADSVQKYIIDDAVIEDGGVFKPEL